MTWKDLQTEPTLDLIEYIKCKGHSDYTLLAEAAFAAFTFRFQAEIIDRCRKLGMKSWKLDRETCDQMATRTFERFLKYPFGFKAGNCGTLDIDTCIKLYLFRIAQRCFIDLFHSQQQSDYPYDGTEEVIVEFPDVDDMDYTSDAASDVKKMQAKIERALSALGPKHRMIYLTYMAHSEDGYKLPRGLLVKLREETGLSQSSIRVYKKEAFDAVKNELKK